MAYLFDRKTDNIDSIMAIDVNELQAAIEDISADVDAIVAFGLCQGRLTLESGVPVSTTEQSDKTTLYFTPFNGTYVDLYDGSSAWSREQFSELSLSLSGLTPSKPHDIFIYDNAGTLALSATEWTNYTTRATELTYQNGIYVLTGATNKRYIGTIYMDSGQKCQDTLTKAYVWNYYNQVRRRLYMTEATSHSYNGANRLWNNSETNNRLNFVSGISDIIMVNGTVRAKAGADGNYAFTYFYFDGSSFGYILGNYNAQIVMSGAGMNINHSSGYHYINVYEGSDHASSTFVSMYVYASNMR